MSAIDKLHDEIKARRYIIAYELMIELKKNPTGDVGAVLAIESALERYLADSLEMFGGKLGIKLP